MTTYTGTNANNTLVAANTVSNDDMYGLDGNDTINAYAGNDTLDGGNGDDTLIGGVGADVLIGGAGFDFAQYGGTVGIAVNLATGVGTGDAAGDTFSSIEGVIGTGGNDSLIGDAVDNQLRGGSGNDTLDGGMGNDTLDGGVGTDTVSYAWATSGISVDLWTGVNAGVAADDVLTNIENIIGTAYNDTFGGNGGTRALQGGPGDDLYILRTNLTSVVEGGGEGYDEVQAITNSISTWTVDAHVEKFLAIATVGITVIGNAMAEHIVGGSGNDTFPGTLGADTLDGGAGIDLVSYAASATAVGVYLGGGFGSGDAAGDVFIDIENAYGSPYADVLFGSSADNLLEGRDGNDFMQGDAGNDTIKGGNGDDTLLGGSGNDVIYTNAGVNYVDAGAGDDTIYLSAGAQTVQAFAGMGVDWVSGFNNRIAAGADPRIQVLAGDTYVVSVVGSDVVVDFGSGNKLILAGQGPYLGSFTPDWIYYG
jgi:Ca2+-binding RTX toxin-like protein